MEYHLLHANKVSDVDVHKENEGFRVTINDKVYEISELVVKENTMTFKIGGNRHSIYFAKDNDKRFIAFGGEYYIVEIKSTAAAHLSSTSLQQENIVASPMPGLLVKVTVKIGDKVKEGDTLAIVEAMKMQNELRSPVDGRVEAINFKEGEQVDALQAIVEIEAEKA